MGEIFKQLLELIKNNTTFAIIVAIAFVATMFLALTIIFFKIKVKAWKGLIPIYNIMTLLDTLGIPVWMLLVMLIPFVNIVGIPIMTIIIGWKLGNYCRKGLFMKLGLCLLPPLFIPLLSICYIDIDGSSQFEFEPVKLPTNFSLDSVEVSTIDTGLTAMSLTDIGTMDKIAPPVTIREVEIPKIEKQKKDMKDLNVGPANNEVEDLNRVLPTADDLTFDYNSLYQGNEKEAEPIVEEKLEIITEEPLEEVEIAKVEETITNDNSLEKVEDVPADDTNSLESESIEEEKIPEAVEEEIEEEPTIVIHDVVLEAAEPVIDSLGPIPINRRYDFQTTKTEKNVKEVGKIETSTKEVAQIETKESIENIEPVEETTEEFINPMAPPVIPPIVSPTTSISEEKKPVEEVVEETSESSQNIEAKQPAISPKIEIDESLPMQAANPFADGMLPSIADIPEVTLPEVENSQSEQIPEVNISEFAMQGLRQQEVVEAGTRVDQIVSMNIEEPSQLPVGVLTNAPGMQKKEPDPIPEPVPEPQPAPQQPTVNPNMTREEAMGFAPRQTFFANPTPTVPTNVSTTPPSPNYTSIFTTGMVATPSVQPMPQMPIQQPAVMPTQPQPMNFPQPMPTGVNMYPNSPMNRMPQQPVMQQPIAPQPTNVFGANTPGGSLLRPVESNLPPAEKTCPVCGVKLKQEYPICIMCGYKF